MLSQLFWVFFKLGFLAFGGGYSMIPLMETLVVDKYHFVMREEFIDLIAVADGMPGAIGINIAIFVGFLKRGYLGAAVAAAGGGLPCLIIICLLLSLFQGASQYLLVIRAFAGIRPVVIALVLCAALKIGLHAYSRKGYTVATVAVLAILLLVPSLPIPLLILSGMALGIIVNCILKRGKHHAC